MIYFFVNYNLYVKYCLHACDGLVHQVHITVLKCKLQQSWWCNTYLHYKLKLYSIKIENGWYVFYLLLELDAWAGGLVGLTGSVIHSLPFHWGKLFSNIALTFFEKYIILINIFVHQSSINSKFVNAPWWFECFELELEPESFELDSDERSIPVGRSKLAFDVCIAFDWPYVNQKSIIE